jgi:hypothetical protein
MNAAGQTAGMLREKRPAAAILEEMVSEAADILGFRIQQSVSVEP